MYNLAGFVDVCLIVFAMTCAEEEERDKTEAAAKAKKEKQKTKKAKQKVLSCYCLMYILLSPPAVFLFDHSKSVHSIS